MRKTIVGIVACLVLAGCGSTVQMRGGTTAAGGEFAGQTSEVNDGVAAAASDAPGGGGGTSGVVASGGAARSVTTAKSGGAASASRAASGAHGPGVTDKAITIGFLYAPDAAAYQAALGNTAVTSGDVKGEAEAVVRDINAHGGVGGRRLEVVFHAVQATSAESTAAKVQAACADFTQDHKVLVAMPASDRDLVACMQKAGSVTSSASLASLTDSQFAAAPYFYDVQQLSITKASYNLVEELARDGYFSRWDTTAGAPGSMPVKVGIIVPDTPQWDEAMAKVILPRLAAHGIHVDPNNIQRWHFPNSTGEDGGSVAQIQAAVLRFRSDNVTHIIPTEVNSTAFFARPAESQRYRPRYGLSSISGAQSYNGSLIPAAQLNGAIGIGWSPGVDLPAAMNPDNGPYSGPGAARCMKVMTDNGYTFSDTNAKTVALVLCDELYSVQDAVNRIPKGTAINATTYMRAVEGFGASFSIAGLPSGSFGPGKHYPVDSAWRWQFFPDCQCMHYTGAKFKLL